MIETKDFIDSKEQLKISYDIVCYLKENGNLPKDGKLPITNSTKRIAYNSIYAIWNIRIPDIDFNSGK